MKRFVEGADRRQSTLFPECLEDWIGENNPVRVIDVFVEELDLAELGFDGVDPETTGRPSFHPSMLLKLYIYGCLNRVQSSRQLEREAGHKVEVMWLTGRLVPDHKTIADFRKRHRCRLGAWNWPHRSHRRPHGRRHHAGATLQPRRDFWCRSDTVCDRGAGNSRPSEVGEREGNRTAGSTAAVGVTLSAKFD